MPSYGFSPARARSPRTSWAADCLRCDLARPADELLVLAAIVSHAAIFEAWVDDAVLMLRPHHSECDYPEVIERLARWHVDAARTALREVLEAPDVFAADLLAAPDRPLPIEIREVGFYDFADVYSKGATQPRKALPEAFLGQGCLVHLREDGGHDHPVTFAIPDWSTPTGLEEAVLGLFGMISGVSATPGRWPVRMLVDGRRLDERRVFSFANAALRLARSVLAVGKRRIEDLPVKGQPSIFTPEDDDARDVLLAQVVAGATIDAMFECDGDEWAYSVGGEPVARHIFDRVAKARWLECTDRGGGERTSFKLWKYAKPTPRKLAPRDYAVSFDAFQSWCRFRRHTDDGSRECAHPAKNDESRCDCHGCPLASPVHKDEIDWFADDPVFAWCDSSEIDVQVTADDVRTERSQAWQAAGKRRIEAVVHLVAGAYVNYSAPYLCDSATTKAAREAVGAGYLEVVEETPLGPVVGLGAMLKSRYDEALAARAARGA